jgi:hypothetical protein
LALALAHSLVENRSFHDDVIAGHPGKLVTLLRQPIHGDVHVEGPVINPGGFVDFGKFAADEFNLGTGADYVGVLPARPSDRSVLKRLLMNGFRSIPAIMQKEAKNDCHPQEWKMFSHVVHLSIYQCSPMLRLN